LVRTNSGFLRDTTPPLIFRKSNSSTVLDAKIKSKLNISD
jgi:hypothetical protein